MIPAPKLLGAVRLALGELNDVALSTAVYGEQPPERLLHAIDLLESILKGP